MLETFQHGLISPQYGLGTLEHVLRMIQHVLGMPEHVFGTLQPGLEMLEHDFGTLQHGLEMLEHDFEILQHDLKMLQHGFEKTQRLNARIEMKLASPDSTVGTMILSQVSTDFGRIGLFLNRIAPVLQVITLFLRWISLFSGRAIMVSG